MWPRRMVTQVIFHFDSRTACTVSAVAISLARWGQAAYRTKSINRRGYWSPIIADWTTFSSPGGMACRWQPIWMQVAKHNWMAFDEGGRNVAPVGTPICVFRFVLMSWKQVNKSAVCCVCYQSRFVSWSKAGYGSSRPAYRRRMGRSRQQWGSGTSNRRNGMPEEPPNRMWHSFRTVIYTLLQIMWFLNRIVGVRSRILHTKSWTLFVPFGFPPPRILSVPSSVIIFLFEESSV